MYEERRKQTGRVNVRSPFRPKSVIYVLIFSIGFKLGHRKFIFSIRPQSERLLLNEKKLIGLG